MAHMARPGGEAAIWFDLANSRYGGPANLQAVFGTPAPELLRRWILSVAMDDRILHSGELTDRLAHLQQPSWNWQNLSSTFGLPRFAEETDLNHGRRRVVLRGSSGLFLRSSAREVMFRVGDQPPPESVVVSVTRIN